MICRIERCRAAASTAGLLEEEPELVNLPLPASLELRPTYGLAAMTEDPTAERFALFVLSDLGRAMLARSGCEPLAATP